MAALLRGLVGSDLQVGAREAPASASVHACVLPVCSDPHQPSSSGPNEAPPPCRRFKFPLLGAASALLLSNTGRMCSNPNFASSYAALFSWLHLPAALAGPAGQLWPSAAHLCSSCQTLAVLSALTVTGHWLYATELRQRRAFLVEMGAAGQQGPAAHALPSTSEYWTSFAIPAACCLYTYIAAAQ